MLMAQKRQFIAETTQESYCNSTMASLAWTQARRVIPSYGRWAWYFPATSRDKGNQTTVSCTFRKFLDLEARLANTYSLGIDLLILYFRCLDRRYAQTIWQPERIACINDKCIGRGFGVDSHLIEVRAMYMGHHFLS